MKLRLVTFLFAIIIGTVAATEADDMAAICKKVGDGEYKKYMVMAARVVHHLGPDVIAGRCGPEHCTFLCKDAKDFESTGAGEACKCIY
jgi:hypothetical protein